MRCVYCLSNRVLRDAQVLVRGSHFYLCAPRGQMVEGYLAIVPYGCIGTLAMMPTSWLPELRRMHDMVVQFYRSAYGMEQAITYEQGRAGGGQDGSGAAGFPLHAHLCCLPARADLHGLLARTFLQRHVGDLDLLADAVGRQPYIYVEGQGRCVYLPRCESGRSKLERMRLKPAIAELLGVPERGYWRDYPGDRELSQVIRRFDTFRRLRAS